MSIGDRPSLSWEQSRQSHGTRNPPYVTNAGLSASVQIADLKEPGTLVPTHGQGAGYPNGTDLEDVLASASAIEPRTQSISDRIANIIQEHTRRLSIFSIIGGIVFVAGLVFQIGLVRVLGMGADASYAAQAVFSIELSYVLNRYLTWPDGNVGFWAACWKFNVQKLIMAIFNMAAYALLVHYGVGYIWANILLTVVFTPVNYLGAHLLVFITPYQGAHRSVRRLAGNVAMLPGSPPVHLLPSALPQMMPSVSVVIPCKSSHKTIRATVDALLGQDYPALVEVICVGDPNDSTWAALRDIRDPRLLMLEYEKASGTELREPNSKRDAGLRKATGEVLALADSDIIMDPDWLTNAVKLLLKQGGGVVAGGMRSVHDSFWGRFVDYNALAAKTPRLSRPYTVTAQSFGKHGQKPPVTANTVFSREVYDACPLDCLWAYGYEDYEWFWRLAKGGHKILFSRELTAAHHHRRSFRRLVEEYRRSAEGCARFISRHEDCPLARKRRLQAVLLPIAAGSVLAGALTAWFLGEWRLVLTAATVTGVAVAAREVVVSKRVEALGYPAFSAALGLVFTSQLIKSMVVAPAPPESVNEDYRAIRKHSQTAISPNRIKISWATTAIVAALIGGLAVRLYHIGSAPEWQLDEITYNSVALQLFKYGTLNVPLAYGQPFQPFLYHPPFYLYELEGWYRLTALGITSARVLGVVTTSLALVLLARLITRLYDAATAAFCLTLISFDGWLIYVGRISYIENSVLALMMISLTLYARAVRTHTWADYLASGFATGATACFNNDAGYLVAVLIIHMVLIRRDIWKHMAAYGAVLLVIAAYVISMVKTYTIGGTDWWWNDTSVQLNRLIGHQPSAGTLQGPGQFVNLLVHQYVLFVPSVMVSGAAGALLVWKLVLCVRRRRLSSLGSEMLIPAWALAALAVFGPASLHYSQYFIMVLLPLYVFLWTNVWAFYRKHSRPILMAASVILICSLGIGSATLRLQQNQNAFKQFQSYAATKIPRTDLIVAGTAGDPIAYVINQPWCSPGTSLSPYCSLHASYVVTWQTFLQPANPLHLLSLQELLDRSREVAEFQQFSGVVTVYQVMQQ